MALFTPLLVHSYPYPYVMERIMMVRRLASSPYDIVRFAFTPKPADVNEHLKPNTRPYH